MSDYSQRNQWFLIDTWLKDPYPKKDFSRFLSIHNYPSSAQDENGIHFLQISRKLLYANKEDDPLNWVKRRAFESEILDEKLIVVNRFIHDAEYPAMIKNLINTNQYWTDTNIVMYRIIGVLAFIILALLINSAH